MAALVFASGAAALVFQIAWMRELRLVFGATTAAVSAVLAVFMGGLGVGSAVLGPRADRTRKPLAFYGGLEIAIALSAAASPWLVMLASKIYIAAGGQQSLGMVGATIVRLMLTVVIIGLPAFFMGGTLPAAVRAATHATDRHRGALGALYGANTLGAVCGTAWATFFALELLGTRATLWAGCALGLAAGGLAVLQARRLPPLDPEHTRQGPGNKETAADISPISAHAAWHSWVIYLTAAILGFTFFALELVWYRMLAPILGGTTFTFGLILCVALLGIGLGGIAYKLLSRWLTPTWGALSVTCGLEAALAILPFALGDRLAVLAAHNAQSASTFGDLVLGWSYIAAIVVFPVALVSGLQFPLLTALLGQARKEVSKHLGLTYAWNTLGAISGSLVAGFGALPLLSAPGLWKVLAVTLGLLSLALLALAPQRSRATVLVAGLAVATFGSLFATGPTAAWRHGGIGAGRAEIALDDANRVRQWQNDKRRTLVWEADGIESSIGIEAPNGLSFAVNGKSDGNALADAPTQIGVAILGAVLHPDPRTGLVIGLGTGESAGWLAQMREFERVDVVELEPAIDEMARRSSALNWDVLNHPRVRRIYNDGREFVLTTRDTYDLLLSEPSNPYRAGIASLYTVEFYHAVLKRLNPGGLFIQWLQAYEVDVETIATVLATARSVFAHVEVWQTLAGDLQLVCAARQPVYSLAGFREAIEDPVVQQALAAAWHVHDVEGFLAHFAAGAGWAEYIARQPHVALNTDDQTLLEYRFAKMVGQRTPFSLELARSEFQENWRRLQLNDNSLDWDQIELRRQEFNLLLGWETSIALLDKSDDRALVEALKRYRNHDFAGTVSAWPSSHLPPRTDIQRMVLARAYAEQNRAECLDLISAIAPRFPIDAAALRTIYFWHSGDVAECERALVDYCQLLQADPWIVLVVSQTALSHAIDISKTDPAVAQRMFDLLATPLAAARFEQMRLVTRFMVARSLGHPHIVEALEALEPHVPWSAEVLQTRAETYAAVGHPQAESAAGDWETFQQNAQ